MIPDELPRRERRHISRVSSQEEIAHAFHCWVGYVKKRERTYWSLVIVIRNFWSPGKWGRFIREFVGLFISRGLCSSIVFVACVWFWTFG
jgi:hypothetical protein